MYDFTRLQAALDQALVLAANLRSDVVNLHGQIQARDARILELEAQVDPTAQAKLDTATATAEQLVTDLGEADALTPELPNP